MVPSTGQPPSQMARMMILKVCPLGSDVCHMKAGVWVSRVGCPGNLGGILSGSLGMQRRCSPGQSGEEPWLGIKCLQTRVVRSKEDIRRDASRTMWSHDCYCYASDGHVYGLHVVVEQ